MSFSRVIYKMDMDWRFCREDRLDSESSDTSHGAIYNSVKTGNAGGPATKKAYDDSEWEQVNLPHDYMRESEFSPEAIGNHGYHVMYNGWYRKTFAVDPSLEGSHAMLVFDGISTSSIVWLNGSILKRSFSGYYELALDVTDRLYYDRINTLTVYTKGDDIEGWWYEGAGIYRHVNLYIKHPLHIAHNGLWAKPVLSNEQTDEWTVELETTLENSAFEEQGGSLCARLWDGDTLVCETVSEEGVYPADDKCVLKNTLAVVAPDRWDVDSPKLYTLTVDLVRDGEVVDTESTRIGFRTCVFDAERGFFLNGRPLKIKGTCNHQDHAGVGVAVPDSIQYYRVRRLKEMGCNAYRCSHNPPAREILDACDEYGLLVMDENRTFETRADAIENFENLVRRDRNHPCVFMWSLFNEEPLQNTTEGRLIFRRLKSALRKLGDPRPTVGAINDRFHLNGSAAEMDVMGKNYGIKQLNADHTEWPGVPLIGSENNSAVTTRGCYISDREGAQILNNYDEELVPWGQSVRETWKKVREHDWFSGIFIWTGFDYRGEPTPFKWPSVSSQFGILDTCGFPKDSYYFNQACFIDEPMMHLLPHWNWKDGETVRVMTVTNCDEVELFLNGKSLGRRASDICEQCEWSVLFEAGTLSAVGYRDGKAVARAENKTAGKAVAIQLTPDRTVMDNKGQDTVPVRVSVVDENGVELPDASDLITFEVVGEGRVAGVGNGDPNSHEPDHVNYRKLYCGLAQVLVMAELGAKSLKLIAHGEGLRDASVTFEIEACEAPNYLFSRPNCAVTGILASVADSPEKPDPAKVWGEDDMNSFAPMVVEGSGFCSFMPSGFQSGWRELRIPVTLPKSVSAEKVAVLEFASVICDEMEFYLDGKEFYRAAPAYKAPVQAPLPKVDKKKFEIRVLVKARSNCSGRSGFAQAISMTVI